jgi:hypothetical protein
MASKGKPCFHYSQAIIGETYYEVLAKWIKWSSEVALALKDHYDALNSIKLSNCWVSAGAYYESLKKIEEKFQGKSEEEVVASLKPRPSFFNPIFRSKNRFYRICDSLWCGNVDRDQFMLNMRHFEKHELFQDYRFAWHSLSCPDYGLPVVCFKDRLTFQHLKSIVLQLLTY